jgi:hypothetical protein
MRPGNRFGTARAGFAARGRACAVDDFGGSGIAAARRR